MLLLVSILNVNNHYCCKNHQSIITFNSPYYESDFKKIQRMFTLIIENSKIWGN